MAKSLVAEIKSQVIALLKTAYPDRYKTFTFKTERWSTGGSVDVTWVDGPAETEVDKHLKTINTSIMICTHRKYSESFIHHIAEEYTSVKGCEMPTIEVRGDGTTWFAHDYTRTLPIKEIVLEMRRLDENELATLAYRLHMVNNVFVPVRTWIVRRRDYSHGKYPEYAVAREKSYCQYVRSLFRVRRRINENWVEVVEDTSLFHVRSLFDLDEHVRLHRRNVYATKR
jgi:hypothetical protein